MTRTWMYLCSFTHACVVVSNLLASRGVAARRIASFIPQHKNQVTRHHHYLHSFILTILYTHTLHTHRTPSAHASRRCAVVVLHTQLTPQFPRIGLHLMEMPTMKVTFMVRSNSKAATKKDIKSHLIFFRHLISDIGTPVAAPELPVLSLCLSTRGNASPHVSLRPLWNGTSFQTCRACVLLSKCTTVLDVQ